MNNQLPYSLKMTVVMCAVWLLLVFGLCYSCSAGMVRIEYCPIPVGEDACKLGSGWYGAIEAVYDDDTGEVATARHLIHAGGNFGGYGLNEVGDDIGWFDADSQTFEMTLESNYGWVLPESYYNEDWETHAVYATHESFGVSGPEYNFSLAESRWVLRSIEAIPEPSAAALGLVGIICIFQRWRSQRRTL